MSNIDNESLDLIIIPHKDFKKLDLNNMEWQMINDMDSLETEEDFQEFCNDLRRYCINLPKRDADAI